ncbi:unnamed protein product [Rhizoctonia solani]|uniref:CcmS related domain-containing protein n=1 Tax=Rhizoctonia solani TaxID=456999 RepID=A0A8H3H3Z1_9AGAM|nr:unnamed protein product [Rhizoctonia solani]
MPIRKPRRQTLQQLAYPPVPVIGGKDLRADEALLGLSDWEIGDHSTRYPQTLPGSSFDGGRWGGSAVGSSAIGSTVAYSSVGGSDVSRPSLAVPSSKASEVSSATRSETTHHVRRKMPPTLGPEQSTPSAPLSTASSSPPKSSASKLFSNGIVRPGDIVPPDWSAAAVSVIGSAPPSVVAPTPAPTSNVGSVTISSTSIPPSSYKQPQNRKPSQPPPRAPSSGYSHSHVHSQPVLSVPTLPPIAASPRTSVADTLNLTQSGSKAPVLAQVASISTPQSSSHPVVFPQGAASMTLQAALKQVPPSAQNPQRQEWAQPPQLSYTTSPTSNSNSPGLQLLHVPPSSYNPSSQSHPAPASVVGSYVSAPSSQSSRALPMPPPRSVVSAVTPTPQTTLGVSHPPPSSIQVWRAGVMTSGPRGWGVPPPGSQPSHHQTSHSTYSTPTAFALASSQPQPNHYQTGFYSSKTQSRLAVPPPPVRRYSYDTPTSGLPLPSQLSTNLDGYMSSPDVSGQLGASPVAGGPHLNPPADDGKPGIQRAPSKLRRKLTKNRAWAPNVPVSAAPALSTPAAASTSTSGSTLVPRQQLSSARAKSSTRVIQSGGQALVPAQRAFIGSHRPAHERILWSLPLDRDPRVRHTIVNIESIKDAVVTFGAEQFVETKMKGAVICNVDYRRPDHPDDLAFDWITYKDAQKTLDPTLQKSITRNDPANAVLVVIFLLSPSLNSLAIWRKSVPMNSNVDRVLAYKVERVKRETAGQEKDMAIRL